MWGTFDNFFSIFSTQQRFLTGHSWVRLYIIPHFKYIVMQIFWNCLVYAFPCFFYIWCRVAEANKIVQTQFSFVIIISPTSHHANLHHSPHLQSSDLIYKAPWNHFKSKCTPSNKPHRIPLTWYPHTSRIILSKQWLMTSIKSTCLSLHPLSGNKPENNLTVINLKTLNSISLLLIFSSTDI